MLVLTRRKDQKICIGDDIEIIVTEIHGGSVKLGVTAPKFLAVDRGEVREEINQRGGKRLTKEEKEARKTAKELELYERLRAKYEAA